MRKKANAADVLYIEKYHTVKTLEEISEELDLSLETIKLNVPIVSAKQKRAKRLGQSVVKLKDGSTVYQMTEDIDVYPDKPKMDQDELDKRRGIYRAEE